MLGGCESESRMASPALSVARDSRDCHLFPDPLVGAQPGRFWPGHPRTMDVFILLLRNPANPGRATHARADFARAFRTG